MAGGARPSRRCPRARRCGAGDARGHRRRHPGAGPISKTAARGRLRVAGGLPQSSSRATSIGRFCRGSPHCSRRAAYSCMKRSRTVTRRLAGRRIPRSCWRRANCSMPCGPRCEWSPSRMASKPRRARHSFSGFARSGSDRVTRRRHAMRLTAVRGGDGKGFRAGAGWPERSPIRYNRAFGMKFMAFHG